MGSVSLALVAAVYLLRSTASAAGNPVCHRSDLTTSGWSTWTDISIPSRCTKLSLDSAGLRDADAPALAAALANAPQLVELILRYNRLTERAASTLADAVKAHPSIKVRSTVRLPGSSLACRRRLEISL
jgi:hypothetical protein